MRLVAWNLNHRTRSKPIMPAVAEALIALEPDWLVLTEYVAHDSHTAFIDRLADFGIRYACVSDDAPRQNRVVIASRWEIHPGTIRLAIDEAVPSNVLHVVAPTCGMEAFGLRLPDYSKRPAIRRAWWTWLAATAGTAVDRPFILAGDFNTDASYPKARCGERLEQLAQSGWQHAAPADGASYVTLMGLERRIDHAFVSRHFRVAEARYVTESAGHPLIGKPAEALSDHAALLIDVETVG